jgi:para-aminobenzoate synthetase
MRYNSLILISTNDRLIQTAWDESGTLMMGLRHKVLPIFGIQFHPESVGSPFGNKIIRNFMSRKPITISEKYAENKIN